MKAVVDDGGGGWLVRVTVDARECEANGICVGVAPEVFELDDDEVLHILRPVPPPELHDSVRQAVDRCPKQALYLDRRRGGSRGT